MNAPRPPRFGISAGVDVGIAHHLGWAVAVTATSDHTFVDRRRMDLIAPAPPTAPIHHVAGPHALHRSGEPLDDATLSELVGREPGLAR